MPIRVAAGPTPRPLDLGDGTGDAACMLIFKVFRSAEFAAFTTAGETAGAPVDLADGYIHLSTADQVQETLAKHFAGEVRLTLLALESDTLGDELKWEPSRGGALFPHLYRKLRLADVLWSAPIPFYNGRHIVPKAPE